MNSPSPETAFTPTRPSLDAALQAPARGAPDTRSQQMAFAEVLGRASAPGPGQETVEQRARSGARQLVAVALVQPLLKNLRETGRAAPPFAPTQAEKQLRALQDAALAQQVVLAGRFPLVERVAQKMLARATHQLAPSGTEAVP